MSDVWPYENGIDVQHFRNFFFLSHHSWWWEWLEMPLAYLVSTPFLLSWLPKISLHMAPVRRRSSYFLFMNGMHPFSCHMGVRYLRLLYWLTDILCAFEKYYYMSYINTEVCINIGNLYEFCNISLQLECWDFYTYKIVSIL